jgi:hypothetical protein
LWQCIENITKNAGQGGDVIANEKAVRAIVKTAIEGYAEGVTHRG